MIIIPQHHINVQKCKIPDMNLEQNNRDRHERPKLDDQICKNHQTKNYVENALYILYVWFDLILKRRAAVGLKMEHI